MVEEFSLYFHVPFCHRKCDYCHFYVLPNQARFKELYMQALEREWHARFSLLPSLDGLVSIYFGGGTPLLLGVEPIAQVLSWIFRARPPPPQCEVTLEANPEGVTQEEMAAFRAIGINRVSLGVQSFDPQLLKRLSRTHTVDHAHTAVDHCLNAGLTNLSIDLMYDLPDQTLTSWEATLKCAAQLPITHLSLYNLTIEPHTVFFKKRASLILPDEESSLAFLQKAILALEAAGLKRYEISAFAKPGYQSRHNRGYWTGRPFLGFGPSAWSDWKGSRFRNIAHLHRYARALEENTSPVDFSETLPPERRCREMLAVGLRLLEGIPERDFPASLAPRIAHLEELQLLKREANRLCLTSRGLLLHDAIAEKLFE